MRFRNLKQDKGVAGLTILLSLVVMLFIIGLIVMIFSLMSAELRDATYTSGTIVTVGEEALTQAELIAGTELDGSAQRDAVCTVTAITNGTAGGTLIDAGNYTATSCLVVNSTDSYSTNNWIVNYTYTWSADNTATDVINETSDAISAVVDWFSIFIVIGAMVVLILLTVIIITAIRGSGMIQTGSTQGSGNVGSA